MSFIVLIRGSNARKAWAQFGDTCFCAPAHENESYLVVDDNSNNESNVALFSKIEDARAAGMACRWNNQQFVVFDIEDDNLADLPEQFASIEKVGELIDHCQSF